MEEPLVSIVTPVYNGERYLEACIQSVRNQTYQNWEYIILNNCSTDSSPEIAAKHADADPRIRVVDTTELLPLIRNHNYALRQISPQSQYCKMVHADDMLFAGCLERLVKAALTHPTAGIVGSYCLWGDKVVSDGIPLATTLVPGSELARKTLLDQLYCFWSPSALLLRSDLIRLREPFYTEAYLHADVEALYEILMNADFAFVHQVLTYIRTHEGSATSKETAPNNVNMIARLDLLTRFGPVYLDQQAFRTQLKHKIDRYYGYLVRSVFHLRGRDFWTFQRDAFQNIGHQWQHSKLAYKVVGAFIKSPLNCLKTFFRSLHTKRYEHLQKTSLGRS